MMTTLKKLKIILLLSTFYFLLSTFYFLFSHPPSAAAAVLFLEPPTSQHQAGDILGIEIKIDNERECINAIEADLFFSADILEAIDFSQGSSILSLWVESPLIQQEEGKIAFAGGVPGGYCGPIAGQGNDQAKTNLLGKVIFRVKDVSETRRAVIGFRDNSRVLLHDGMGSRAELATKGAVLEILPFRTIKPEDQWREEKAEDSIPPEKFSLEIARDPNVFEGKFFLVFSTTDKQTGVDYYEVAEQRIFEDGVLGPKVWQKVKSPCLLKDQTLRSNIFVKAVDKAGNVRVAESVIIPPLALRTLEITWLDLFLRMVIILIIGLIIAAALIAVIERRRQGGEEKKGNDSF